MPNTSYCWSIGFVMQKNHTVLAAQNPQTIPGCAHGDTRAGTSASPPGSHLCAGCGMSPCSCKAGTAASVTDCSSDGKHKQKYTDHLH